MRLAFTELGAGPPVAFLHGLLGAGRNFGAIQKALAARGHRALALDLRNHGRSPHAPGMGYAEMAADVAETLRAAGAWPAAVIGHSMGGKVAMTLAGTRPEGVARLLVADIAPVPYAAAAFRGYIAAMQGLALRPGLTRREAEAALAPAVADPALRGFLLQNLDLAADPPRWRIGLDEIAAGMAEITGWRDPPGPYGGPALVLAGDRSDYIRPEHAPLFRRLFPAVRFASIPAGHWLHADNPQAFLEQVTAFLAG